MYEPIHGSAPDIAGKNIANPIATIASVAMMFEHSFCMPEMSAQIHEAIEAALAEGMRTADIAAPGEKTVSTTEMTAAIIRHLGA